MSSSTETGSGDALIGTVIADRYRLDRLLGEGGMGKVYAAEHVLMRKRLAVKVLHRELCEMPEVIARFEREAMATANIEHANIAAATDCGKLDDGALFLVLELVEGKCLRDEIAEVGAMPLTRALHIARQIAGALAAAHELGIVHRDLKPENVMLITRAGEEDFVKVLDFGIAKLPLAQTPGAGVIAAGPLTKAGVVFGTPEYMSPEQALGQNVDGRADLYALGVITYEMLSGVRPFDAESDVGLLGQQLAKPVPTIAERAPGVTVPRQVEEVVTKLLSKDIHTRYQTAAEVVAAFDELAQPAPGGDARLFTLPDGSPTAFLGTAEQVYAPTERPPAPAPAPVAMEVAPSEVVPAAPVPVGPSGTLPLLGADTKQALAESVARARRAQAGAGVREHALGFGREVYTSACRLVDAGRTRLPAGMRRPLREVPTAAILVALFVLCWFPQVIGLALIAKAEPKTQPAAPPKRSEAVAAEAPAPDPVLAELAQAKRQGHAALEKLAEQHPKHGAVLLELAASHAGRSDYGAAVSTLGRALSADAKLSSRPEAADVLYGAVRKRDSADATFALLQGPMGAAGAAQLYDMSIDPKLPLATRQRAAQWVRSPEFSRVATPEVAIAGALRYARSCSDRHALLGRAGRVGEKRALAFLKIARRRAGCGRRARDDCFPCLRKDDALERAITSIETRMAQKSQ